MTKDLRITELMLDLASAGLSVSVSLTERGANAMIALKKTDDVFVFTDRQGDLKAVQGWLETKCEELLD